MLAEWYNRILDFLPNLIVIAAILLLTIVISRRSQRIVYQLSNRTQAPPEIIELLSRMARFGVLAVGALLILDRLNLSRTVLSFVAGLGIAGIMLGFALQDIVKQFAAGVLLLILRPFRIGDTVSIGNFTGQVQEVQLRATILKTSTGDEVLIPNADVYNTAIVNTTRFELHQRTVALTLPPQADLGRTRAALLQALSQVPGVLGTPAPEIIATGLKGTTVQLEARFWIDERLSSPNQVTTDAIVALRSVMATSPQAAG